jgi:hypothetical protein
MSVLKRLVMVTGVLLCAAVMAAEPKGGSIFDFGTAKETGKEAKTSAGGQKAVDEAILKEDYDGAVKAAVAAQAAARSSGDAAQLSAATARLANVRQLQAQATKVAAALTKLKTYPDDAAANLEAGQFLCLWRGDWDKGLPLLVKGSDGDLKALAQEDLAAGIDVPMQFAVANAWWTYSSRLEGPPKAFARDRAAEIYVKIVAKLEQPNRAVAQNRIAQAPVHLPFPRVAAAVATADPKTPVANTVQIVSDDFTCDIYHNGKLIPAENRKLQGEEYGAQGELVTVELKPGDWIVFNVVNNRQRWGGAYYFAAAGQDASGGLAFASDLRSGNWSACDDLKEVSRFVSERDYMKDRAAQAVQKPWDVNNDRIRKGNPDWNGQAIWGDPTSRSTWLKYIVPGGEKPRQAETK